MLLTGDQGDREVRTRLAFNGDLLFNEVVARSKMPDLEIEYLRFFEKAKGPLNNNFTELAPRFASDSVATD